ncbi:7556_t:CDS:2, partial [Racocetra persica]
HSKESKKQKYEESFTLPDFKENFIDVNDITDQAIKLDTLTNDIPLDIEQNKHEHYLAKKIVNYVEKEDGYDYIYHTKTTSQKTNIKTFYY